MKKLTEKYQRFLKLFCKNVKIIFKKRWVLIFQEKIQTLVLGYFLLKILSLFVCLGEQLVEWIYEDGS